MHLSAVNKFLFVGGAWQRSFFVALFFLTLAALLFWLDTFRAYQSEVRVLVIGKSPQVATEQIVENFSELSKNLSFYEQVVAGDAVLDTDTSGYSKDKRKALWNKAVKVKQSGESGVLVVTATQETAESAKRLSVETAQGLFSLAAFYYNVKTDIDMRLVDESILKPTLKNPLSYVAISSLSAFVVTRLFFALLLAIPFFLGKKRSSSLKQEELETTPQKAYPDFKIGDSVPFIDPRKFVPARPTTLSFESHPEEVTMTPSDPVSLSKEKMLPGMDITDLPFEFEEVVEEEKKLPETDQAGAPTPMVSPEGVAAVKTSEPTVEEYKRRLNELLAGGK